VRAQINKSTAQIKMYSCWGFSACARRRQLLGSDYERRELFDEVAVFIMTSHYFIHHRQLVCLKSQPLSEPRGNKTKKGSQRTRASERVSEAGGCVTGLCVSFFRSGEKVLRRAPLGIYKNNPRRSHARRRLKLNCVYSRITRTLSCRVSKIRTSHTLGARQCGYQLSPQPPSTKSQLTWAPWY